MSKRRKRKRVKKRVKRIVKKVVKLSPFDERVQWIYQRSGVKTFVGEPVRKTYVAIKQKPKRKFKSIFSVNVNRKKKG